MEGGELGQGARASGGQRQRCLSTRQRRPTNQLPAPQHTCTVSATAIALLAWSRRGAGS